MSAQTLAPADGGRDFWAPAFQLRLNGAPAGQDVVRDVLSVSYQDSLTDVDSLDVVISNWDLEQRTFRYSDDYLFDPGTRVELSLGYHDSPLHPMISGEIVELRPSFPSAGAPTLTIHALNLLHRFRVEQRSRPYTDCTDTQVAQRIADDLHVRLEPPPADVRAREPRYPYLLQDNVYDIVFLLDRARRIGYELRVEERGGDGARLVFGPSNAPQRPAYELAWGRSLIEFQPNLSTAGQVGKVVVHGWDPVGKQPIKFTATQEELSTRGLGANGRNEPLYQSFAERKEVLVSTVVSSRAEAERLALETLQLIAKGLVTGSATTVGLPDLRAGTVVTISGVGTRFDGRYYVTDSTHTLGENGYLTQFSFRREELQRQS